MMLRMRRLVREGMRLGACRAIAPSLVYQLVTPRHFHACSRGMASHTPKEAQGSQSEGLPPARLDFRSIRDDIEYHAWNSSARNAVAEPHKAATLYSDRIKADLELNTVRKERNMLSKSKNASREEKRERGKALKQKLAELERARDALAEQLQAEALRVPNATHPAAPSGDEDQAIEVLRAGPLADPAAPGTKSWLGAEMASVASGETGGEGGAAGSSLPQPRDHYELCELLDIADFGSGSRVSGPKFAVFKNAGAMLEMGIALWAAGELRSKLGMEVLVPPDVARADIAAGCGFQPRGVESQTYQLDGTDQVLVATSEVTLTGMHASAVHPTKSLPMVHAGVSHCFRREAGSSGVAQRGLYRLHQFTKAEMVVVCHATPEDGKGAGSRPTILRPAGEHGLGDRGDGSGGASADVVVPLHERAHSEIARRQLAGVPQPDGRPVLGGAAAECPTATAASVPQGTTADPPPQDRYLQDLVAIQCWLLDQLGLSYRVLDMPTAELGASASRKFDVEAWMPGRRAFGEVCSASDCGDYQARRLGIQYEAGGSRGRVFAHTLNATAVAVPRVLLAILETHQREDGSVVIPECLRPFLGGQEVLEPVPAEKRTGMRHVGFAS